MKEQFEIEIDDFTRYRIGETVQNESPAEETHKNMLYLVAYDVRNPKRLARACKVCKDYGVRVEYSVFECDLTEEQFGYLWQSLQEVIDIEEDVILAYRLCGACAKQVESAGVVKRPGKVLLYYA